MNDTLQNCLGAFLVMGGFAGIILALGACCWAEQIREWATGVYVRECQACRHALPSARMHCPGCKGTGWVVLSKVDRKEEGRA